MVHFRCSAQILEKHSKTTELKNMTIFREKGEPFSFSFFENFRVLYNNMDFILQVSMVLYLVTDMGRGSNWRRRTNLEDDVFGSKKGRRYEKFNLFWKKVWLGEGIFELFRVPRAFSSGVDYTS